jgi:membrane-associated phospholipid phosphatase
VLGLVLAVLWRRPWLFVQVVIADAVADVLAYALRHAIGRPRPPSVYAEPEPLVSVPHSSSFPSGHAATSFACATTLAFAAPRLAPGFFVLAAAIAWSRVYVGVHYPLDVLGGALLGVLVATLLRFLARRWRWGAGGHSSISTGPESAPPSAARGGPESGSASREARRPGA